VKKKLLAATVFCATVVLAVHFAVTSRVSQSIAQVISELGPPAFLAQSTEVYRRRGKFLRIDVPDIDPRTIQDWRSITNGIAIWTTSDYCKRSAGYFYDDLRDDSNFDGTAYISGDWFGTKFTILQIENGLVISERNIRSAALSVRLVGVSGPAVYGIRRNERLRLNPTTDGPKKNTIQQ
jgi:hypothetical protein